MTKNPRKFKRVQDMYPKFKGKIKGFSQEDIDHFEKEIDQIYRTNSESVVESNQSIFEEGAEIVNGPRHSDYGDFHKNMADIGLVWSGILGFTVEPKKVALCMAGLKLVREANKHKRDNGVDAIGYAGIAHEIGERAENEEL
jgi:hypothetical protein